MTECRVTQIGTDGITAIDRKGQETRIGADTVILAAPQRSNDELFEELEWSVDELHGCGDAVVPRGLTQAIHDGYRLGCRL
jgi:2,4-dienoyl-CoA reductase (NADPH2)